MMIREWILFSTLCVLNIAETRASFLLRKLSLKDGGGGGPPPPEIEDWVLGEQGDSCTTTCSNAGKDPCVTASQKAVDSLAKAVFVAQDVFSLTCEAVNTGFLSIDPSLNVNGACTFAVSNSLCGSTFGESLRFCCCGPKCEIQPKDIAPPSSSPSTSGWCLGAPGASCTTTCANEGKGACVEEAMSAVDDVTKALFVSAVLEADCATMGKSTRLSVDSNDDSCRYNTGVMVTCNDNEVDEQRFCCCGGDIAKCASAP